MHPLVNIDEIIPTLDPASLARMPGDASAVERKAMRRHARRVAARRFVSLTQHRAAASHLDPLPVPGETLHGVMDGRYSGFSLATACIELLGQPVDEMLISTLGFNRQNSGGLCELLDAGTVRSVLLMVSTYFQSSDRLVFADCRRDLESRGQRVAVTRSHAKLILLRAGARHVTIETSANLRSSQNYEQFSVADDRELFEFHAGWINDLLAETAT